MTKVTGRYVYTENGFVYVAVENTLYTIVTPSNWGKIEVGERNAYNAVFTAEMLAELVPLSSPTGTFSLEEV